MTAAKELTEWDLHHVFEVECRGDTLIVTPRGDALGFPEPHFRDAVRRLRERFDSRNGCDGRRPRNLILDATGRDYPGLEMLSAFRELIEAVRQQGGTAAVAGSSLETERVLHEFKIGDDWTVYPDLPAATRAVVREPVTRRVWRRRRVIAVAAAALLLPLIGLAVYSSIDTREDAAAYAELGKIWTQHRQLRLMPYEDAERQRVRDGLANRAAGKAKEYEAQKLRNAASSARQMAEILRSPTQPDPRERRYEELLTAELKLIDRSDRRLVTLLPRTRFDFED